MFPDIFGYYPNFGFPIPDPWLDPEGFSQWVLQGASGDPLKDSLGKPLWVQPRVRDEETEVGVITTNVGKHVISPN